MYMQTCVCARASIYIKCDAAQEQLDAVRAQRPVKQEPEPPRAKPVKEKKKSKKKTQSSAQVEKRLALREPRLDGSRRRDEVGLRPGGIEERAQLAGGHDDVGIDECEHRGACRRGPGIIAATKPKIGRWLNQADPS